MEEHIHLTHVHALGEEEVLHAGRRFKGLNEIIDQILAFVIDDVAVVDLGIEVNAFLRGAIVRIHSRQEIIAALGASRWF